MNDEVVIKDVMDDVMDYLAKAHGIKALYNVSKTVEQTQGAAERGGFLEPIRISKFSVGDVVVLNGGDFIQEMNVLDVNKKHPLVRVAWFDGDGKLLQAVLPESCLSILNDCLED